MEPISQKEILLLKENIDLEKRNIKHYVEEEEYKIKVLKELKERSQWKLDLYETRLRSLSDCLSKEIREDLM